ncbi:MAG: redox-sensitive transcriptional activator SoxR [Actinomycetota bacterium]
MESTHGPDELLAVGEVSQRMGVAVSALHYYERLGLIAALRTPGNQRRYPRHVLRRVALISVARHLGIPLADVKEAFADVPLTTTPTHADWQRASRRWKKVLEQRRLGIERLEKELTGCIGCGCLSMKACRLLNPDDKLADTGSGARRIPV